MWALGVALSNFVLDATGLYRLDGAEQWDRISARASKCWRSLARLALEDGDWGKVVEILRTRTSRSREEIVTAPMLRNDLKG